MKRAIILALVALAVAPLASAALTPPTVDQLAGLASDPALAACSGVAPAEKACDTGYHISEFFGQLGFDPADFVGYTGTVDAKEVWLSPFAGGAVVPEGQLIFRCDVQNGAFSNCHSIAGALSGTPAEFPPAGTIVEHSCASYDLGTTTPGGIGPWRCFLERGLGLPLP